jgi:hypothetical protein
MPRDGGVTIAPPTRKSDRKEGHHGRVAYNIFNLRLTETQFDALRDLRDRTGITIQAHIRRAVLDYLHQLRIENPLLFRDNAEQSEK